MPSLLPPKKDVALALLERASMFIHLDPRHTDVLVPAWFKKQPQLVLQVGLNMAVRIPDLEVTEDAVACTLSFNRSPHYCFVPWHAVYALVGEDGRGMVWPEDIPPEVAAQTRSLGGAMPGARLHAVPSGDRQQERRDSLRPSPSSASESVASESVAPLSVPSVDDTSTSGVRPEVHLDEVSERSADGSGGHSVGSEGEQRLRPSERPYLRLVR